MTSPGLRLRHLTFVGPFRTPATVKFGPGLNVIWGASDTGKSFIVDGIDFMLGGKGPLRDIPERVGYNLVLLGLGATDGETFTLLRNVEGGPFKLYEGLHVDTVPKTEPIELADQHNDKRDDNLSAYLLSKVGLEHKRLKKNKRNDTQSLSFRNLARLLIINEEEIIQKRSPLSDGSYVADTANTSLFKLLLTGVDDSALAATSRRSPEEQSRDAQIDLLEQLIAEYRGRVKDIAGPPAELEGQLERLENTMGAHGEQLAASEAQFRTAASRRRDLLNRLEEGSNRLAEINATVDRFMLLDAHYSSDRERLKGIREAGSLFSALGE